MIKKHGEFDCHTENYSLEDITGVLRHLGLNLLTIANNSLIIETVNADI